MIDLRNILFLVFVSGLSWSLFGQGDWELVKERNEISVFTRNNEASNFKEFKAQMTIEAEVSQFVAVLLDVKGLKDWGYKIKRVELISREQLDQQVYYAEAKAPFPYKNREGYYQNVFRWKKEEATLYVDINLLEKYPAKVGVLLKGEGLWTIRKIADKEIEITFQMLIDPGGSIPAWLSNMFVSDSPYETLSGLRTAIVMDKYKGKTYNFLD